MDPKADIDVMSLALFFYFLIDFVKNVS